MTYQQAGRIAVTPCRLDYFYTGGDFNADIRVEIYV